MIHTLDYAVFQNFEPYEPRRISGQPVRKMRLRVKHAQVGPCENPFLPPTATCL